MAVKKIRIKKVVDIVVRKTPPQPWPNDRAKAVGLRWWGTFAGQDGSIEEMAEAVTRLQSDAGVTGEQLAQILSIKPSSLSQWKSRKYKPSLQAFVNLLLFAANIDHPLMTFFWMRFTGFGAEVIPTLARAALNEKAEILSGRPESPSNADEWEQLLAAADRILKARKAVKHHRAKD